MKKAQREPKKQNGTGVKPSVPFVQVAGPRIELGTS